MLGGKESTYIYVISLSINKSYIVDMIQWVIRVRDVPSIHANINTTIQCWGVGMQYCYFNLQLELHTCTYNCTLICNT